MYIKFIGLKVICMFAYEIIVLLNMYVNKRGERVGGGIKMGLFPHTTKFQFLFIRGRLFKASLA